MSSLKQRLLVGSVVSAIVLFVIALANNAYFKPITMGITTLIIAYSIWEFHQISHNKAQKPAVFLSLIAAIAYAISVALSTQYVACKELPSLVILASLISFFGYYFLKGDSPFLNLAITLFSFVYLAIPLSCMIAITYFFTLSGEQDGRCWIVYLIAVTKMTDTAAFFVGKRFGKTKFAPFISPKKTWEGALGGLASACVISTLLTFVFKLLNAPFSLTLFQSIWMGALLGVLAEFGDLAESLLKRDGGLKDSNHLPGLGGILDMVDSLVFTAPFVYIFLNASFR